MIQISNIEEFKEEDIPKLVTIVNQELLRREALYKRYRRKQYDYEIVGQANKDKVVVPFEKYIVDIATGYLGGKEPTYEVEEVNDDKKKTIKKVLDRDMPDTTIKEEMEEIITYILKYNDDNNENYQLVKDIMLYGSCYEMVYQNKDNEMVYGRLDPLQTVAIWDYSIPKNLIGLVSVYKEQDVNTSIKYVVRIIDKNGTRLYRGFDKTYTQETKDKLGNGEKDNYWGDVPAIVVETEDNLSLFEPAIDLIEAYQSLIKNTKETFNYNNDAKLKITGYLPENPLMVMDEKTGLLIENEERKKEDETLLKAPVFYTPQDGDISWVEKTIDDGATQNTLKTYIDLIMMITGTPQVTDLGFEKADNASAIDRKFFTLEQMTTQAMQLLKTAYLRRWELIFNRINELKNTNYDFRNIKITLNKNLPANENEVVDMYMKLRGLISDETIIERLPLNFDSVSELQKKADQEEENMQKYMDNAQQFNQSSKQEQQVEEKQKEEEIKTEQQ